MLLAISGLIECIDSLLGDDLHFPILRKNLVAYAEDYLLVYLLWPFEINEKCRK
jgi:hypothetical protein